MGTAQSPVVSGIGAAHGQTLPGATVWFNGTDGGLEALDVIPSIERHGSEALVRVMVLKSGEKHPFLILLNATERQLRSLSAALSDAALLAKHVEGERDAAERRRMEGTGRASNEPSEDYKNTRCMVCYRTGGACECAGGFSSVGWDGVGIARCAVCHRTRKPCDCPLGLLVSITA